MLRQIVIVPLRRLSAAARQIGAAREVFAKYPEIKEIAQGYANWSPVDGKKVRADWLKTLKHIDGVWSDGSQGVGAVNAYLEAKQPVPPITGCDINK